MYEDKADQCRDEIKRVKKKIGVKEREKVSAKEHAEKVRDDPGKAQKIAIQEIGQEDF